MSEKISRRRYLKYVATGVVVAGAVAAGAYYATRPSPSPSPSPSPTPKQSTPSPSPSPTPQKPIPLNFTMWTWGTETFKKLLEEWDAKHPKYEASLTDIPEATYREGVLARITAGQPIDVLQSDPVWQSEFYEAGYIVPMEDYYPEIRKYVDDYWPAYAETCFYKGKMMGILYYGANMLLQYNTEYVEKAGFDEPPETWEDVIEQSLAIKEKGIVSYPICAFLGSYAFWQTLYAFIAGQAKNNDEVRLFDPETMDPLFVSEDHALFKALRFLLDAIHEYEVMSTASITYADVEVIQGMGGGSHAFGWIPWYDVGPANSPEQPMYKKLQIALNPGPAHISSCWGRPYNVTKMCADRGPEAMEGAYKLMMLFGGRCNEETLDPDWENGRYVLGLRILPIGGTPLVWTKSGLDYPETRETIGSYADLEIAKEQFKRLFNHQMDPPGPPHWLVKWSGGWGMGFARSRLEALLYGREGTKDSDIMRILGELADEWLKVRKEYEGY